MTRIPGRRIGPLLLAVVAILHAPTVGRAAEVTAKSTSIPGPKEAFASMQPQREALSPASEVEANNRQANLGDHHRPIPLGPTPLGAASVTAPPGSGVEVGTLLSPQPGSVIQVIADRTLKDSETGNSTSTVCEPSVAARGDAVLVVGNWFSAFSKDSGNTFKYVNPANAFPEPAANRFCCDQVAIYDAKRDLMIWLIQYRKSSEQNFMRIAVARGADIAEERWRYYDVWARDTLGLQNEWLDYPDLALSDAHLYLTANCFSTGMGEKFTRGVAMRVPLGQMASYQPLTLQYYETPQIGGLRLTQGAGETMYIGAHRDLATIRVFSWPDATDKLNFVDVAVTAWDPGPYEAISPDGREWLQRCDGRITAGWLAKGTIGFAWAAAQDAGFPYPHVRMAILDQSSKVLVAEPVLWNRSHAFAYPALAPNSAGDLGLSVFAGGPPFHPRHVIGVVRPGPGPIPWATPVWSLVATGIGTHTPYDYKWGDYLGVRVLGTDPTSWITSGFSLQNGGTTVDVEVRVTKFRTVP